MNLIILGPQASGKGTQADILTEKLGLLHFEMGAILREEAKKSKEIDMMVNQKGVLVPDDIAFGVLQKYIKKNTNTCQNIIFDGFPRSIPQYELFKEWLKNCQGKIDKVIFLEISEEEVLKRLSGRRTCLKCGNVYNLITFPKPPKNGNCSCGGKLIIRKDDKKEIILERLHNFQESTQPLLKVFSKEKLLVSIDGSQPIKKVSQDILEKIKEE